MADFSSPHARGDGPAVSNTKLAVALFSPRAWGWSDSRSQHCHPPLVLPTRVGMVRIISTANRARSSSPHARGDGPFELDLFPSILEFSPRAWGWSGHNDEH